jgi:uncharacterized protein YbjT (DUF2867 family)
MKLAVAGATGTVGRYVVEAAESAGHTVVRVSRADGVDVLSGDGLNAALAGVEVVVDALNLRSVNRSKATAFFTRTTRRLQEAGAAAGARRLVTLSIVGLERVPSYGYYRAKLAQEQAARSGPLPATVLRATQFHEFPGQILAATRRGPLALMPRMRVQPVAARTVGAALVEAATGPSAPDLLELAGPAPEDLVDLARRLLRHQHARVAVLGLPWPGATGAAMGGGAILPDPGVRIAGPTFDEWLRST